MTTAAGKRDQLIRFERAVTVDSPLGGKKPDGWALLQKAWASVRYGTAAERREAGAQGASQAATFRTLSSVALRGVTVQDRLVDAFGQVWNIVAPANLPGNGEIEFTCIVNRG